MNHRIPKEHYVSVNQTQLCVWEWPGSLQAGTSQSTALQPIVLCHATGFHGRCWDQVVNALPDQHIFAIDTRFHGRSDKEGEVSWNTMANDVAEVITHFDLHNMVAVGHSMGGYLVAYVASLMPERFKQLVLIDPVIMSPESYLQLLTALNAMGDFEHPTARRRSQWSSPQEMAEKFSQRQPFDQWNKEVLRDYCQYGLLENPSGDGFILACPPEKEAACYMIKDDGSTIYSAIARLRTPTTLVRARSRNESDEMFSFDPSPTWEKLSEQIAICRDVQLPDHSHFIPMEDPALVVEYIREAIADQWHEQ